MNTGLVPGLVLAAALWLPGMVLGATLTVELSGGEQLDEAVVWLEPVDKDAAPTVAGDSQPARIDQQDRAFSPSVLPVSVGRSVRFQNSDSVRHHVYSFSNAKRFELPLFKSGESHLVTFDEPGVVVLGCNIHDQMVGYVVVTHSETFETADAAGAVELKAPPGRYRLRIWHPRLIDPEQPHERRVALGASESSRVQVALSLRAPPERRVFSREALRGDG